jgi:hypothetical protein
MDVLTLIIALAALVIAVAAYSRTGGMRELGQQVQSLNAASDSVREKTADALARLEQLIRTREKPGPDNAPPPGAPPSGEPR